jgi:hypothetical protein
MSGFKDPAPCAPFVGGGRSWRVQLIVIAICPVADAQRLASVAYLAWTRPCCFLRKGGGIVNPDSDE